MESDRFLIVDGQRVECPFCHFQARKDFADNLESLREYRAMVGLVLRWLPWLAGFSLLVVLAGGAWLLWRVTMFMVQHPHLFR